MRISYNFSELHPISVRTDDDGATHAVYDLPTSIPWTIKHRMSEDYWHETKHSVSRVRIFLANHEVTDEPYAGVVPYDEAGKEHPISSVYFVGACSIVAVLNRLGFGPIQASN